MVVDFNLISPSITGIDLVIQQHTVKIIFVFNLRYFILGYS